MKTSLDSIKTSLDTADTAVSPQKEALEAQLEEFGRLTSMLLNARQKTVEAKVADLEKQKEAASKAREEAIGKLAAA